MAQRGDLERELKELRGRYDSALEGFSNVTEEALSKQFGIDFVHPAAEQVQHQLALRARTMAFRAVADGHIIDAQDSVSATDAITRGFSLTGSGCQEPGGRPLLLPDSGTAAVEREPAMAASEATVVGDAPKTFGKILNFGAELKKTQSDINQLNVGATGTMCQTLPMLRAARKARKKSNMAVGHLAQQ